MKTWLDFVTGSFAGPVCLAVTIVGIVLSILVWRKKGARSGIRGIAWSLLPLAVYLVHALALVGRIVSAVVQFAVSFAFSPDTYLGVILLVVALVAFVFSGGIPLVRSRKRRAGRENAGRDHSSRSGPAGNGQAGNGNAPVPAVRKGANAPAADDDLSDVRDILKRHGIN